MNQLIEFLRMFFSYVLVFLVYGAVAGAGIFIGIKWRKSKNAKAEAVGSVEAAAADAGDAAE